MTAQFDMVAAEVGLLHLGGAMRLYDLPTEEASEAMAVALVQADAPGLSLGPASYRALVSVWNDAHRSGEPDKAEEAGDAWMARLWGDG